MALLPLPCYETRCEPRWQPRPGMESGPVARLSGHPRGPPGCSFSNSSNAPIFRFVRRNRYRPHPMSGYLERFPLARRVRGADRPGPASVRTTDPTKTRPHDPIGNRSGFARHGALASFGAMTSAFVGCVKRTILRSLTHQYLSCTRQNTHLENGFVRRASRSPRSLAKDLKLCASLLSLASFGAWTALDSIAARGAFGSFGELPSLPLASFGAVGSVRRAGRIGFVRRTGRIGFVRRIACFLCPSLITSSPQLSKSVEPQLSAFTIGTGARAVHRFPENAPFDAEKGREK